MAKKASAPVKNDTPPTEPDAGAEGTAKVGRPKGFSTKENDVFKAVDPQPTGTEAKIAPQAQAIVNLVIAAGTDGITRKALVESMQGVVQTRQPESRILSYYQKTLTEKGFVTIETPAPAKEEAKAEA